MEKAINSAGEQAGASVTSSAARRDADSAAFDRFLADFRRFENFAWLKINHGFWERTARTVDRVGWPSTKRARKRADKIHGRAGFFSGGFADELMDLLRSCEGNTDAALNIAFTLSAWPDCERIQGIPRHPELSAPFMEKYIKLVGASTDGLLLKTAIHTGRFSDLLQELRQFRVILVGPPYLSGFGDFAGLPRFQHIPIHPTRAADSRREIADEIADTLAASDEPTVVLLQGSSLSVYWTLRLRPKFPKVRWIDGGLSLSICHPEDLLNRPWGIVYRREIARFHNRIVGRDVIEENPRFESSHVSYLSGIKDTSADAPIAFVERKRPDHARISEMLASCTKSGYWANMGPVYTALKQAYRAYLGLDEAYDVIPCASGGIALEAVARLLGTLSQRPLRWVVSAYSFHNQGRGYFSGALVCDCDMNGMLSLKSLRKVPLKSYDGVIVTNIFGLASQFEPYIEFCERYGKKLVIDNAAGIGNCVPDWPYQAFSLHHTKPFGVGEGGLALTPRDEANLFYRLINYDDVDGFKKSEWLNNGKLSDVACAYHLDRLERSPQWLPLYQFQGQRIANLAKRAGLGKLIDFGDESIAMSLPFVANRDLSQADIKNPLLTLGRFYKPLAEQPNASFLSKRVVNVPSHPDLSRIDSDALLALLSRFA